MNWLASIGLMFLCLTLSATADEVSAFARAIAAAPAVTAARLRAEAAQARQGSAGRLPDPTVEAMGAQKTTPTEDNPMWGVAIQQPLPRAGERSAARNRAAAEAAMAQAEWSSMAGELAAETAMRLAEMEAAGNRHKLIAAQLAKTEQARAALDARIATGRAGSPARLALDMRIADMRLMLEKENQIALDAERAARASLTWPIDLALPSYAAPALQSISLEQSPAMQLAIAQERESKAMADMARAGGRPMTAVGLRFDRDQMKDGNEDSVSVTLMSDLPWQGRASSRSDLRAAQATLEASSVSRVSASNDFAALLSRIERAGQFAATTREVVATNQARLDAEYAALLRNASTSGGMGGDNSTLMVLEILERSADLQRQQIDAEFAERSARTELWRYAPTETFLSAAGE